MILTVQEIARMRSLVAYLTQPEGHTVNPNIGEDIGAIEAHLQTYINNGITADDLLREVKERIEREEYVTIDGVRYHKLGGASFYSWAGRYVPKQCDKLQPPGDEKAIVRERGVSLEEAVKQNKRSQYRYSYDPTWFPLAAYEHS